MQLKVLPISKIESAKQQVDEAIWMFFNKRNPIAIHSIVGAAHQVLYDLTDRKGSMIKNDRVAATVGKELEWYKRLNKEYNFFKHAEKDKDGIINFDPLLHTFYLVDCVYMYRALQGKSPYNHAVFDAWFALAHPNAIGNQQAKLRTQKVAKETLDPNNFEFFLEQIENPKVGAE